MTLLRSITLSNVRRFAPEVEIGLGPGATILLAPNGTGKTAIFEAMELALTGKVMRLENDLTPLIRDTMDSCKVRLSFDNAAREVTLSRTGDLSVDGCLEEIFRGIGPEDLPYLLRLTHLLDQREGNWFVQANTTEAGGQLARLPIGKDGAQASSVLTGAKRSATERQKTAEERLSVAREKLARWQKLLDERTAYTSDSGRPLESLETLRSKIRALVPQSASDKAAGQPVLPAVLNTWAEVRSQVDTRIASTQVRSGALAAADSLVEEFLAAKAEVATTQELLERLKVERKGAEESLQQAQAELKSKEDLRAVHEEKRRDVYELIRKVEAVASAEAQQAAKEETLCQVTEALSSAEQELAAARIRLEEAQKLVNLHDALRARAEALVRSEQELSKERDALTAFSENQKDLQGQDQLAEKISAQLVDCEKRYREAELVYRDRERQAAESKATYDTVNAASDAIRNAVGVIATELATDRDDCPVCGQVHGAAELRRRITESLHAIDPSLAIAAQRVKDTSEAMSAAGASLNRASEAVEEVRLRMAMVEDRREYLRIAIAEGEQLFGIDGVEASNNKLSTKGLELNSTREKLNADIGIAPAEPTPQDVAISTGEVRAAESKVEAARQRSEEARAARDHSVENLRATEAANTASEPVAVLVARRTAVDTDLANAKADVEAGRDQRDRKQEALEGAEASVRRTEGTLLSVSDRLRLVRSRWLAIPLEGDPAADTLSFAKATLEEEKSKETQIREVLDSLRSELARWEVANGGLRSLREVEEMRGAFSEEAYTVLVESEVGAAEAEIGRIKASAGALDTLASCLTAELGKIHSRVLSVTPSWRALLNRIVRESRFSQTNFDFYSYYRKQHAEVKVPLHGQKISVSDVASEAQMTDLQLTFLLAMAQGHSWSPWRALLLDDPTQHHDIVHAAGVFDVLRDYIADHGFQVVIATHDALQARFFLRKLQNDGIPARLWALRPTTYGVKATLAETFGA